MYTPTMNVTLLDDKAGFSYNIYDSERRETWTIVYSVR